MHLLQCMLEVSSFYTNMICVYFFPGIHSSAWAARWSDNPSLLAELSPLHQPLPSETRFFRVVGNFIVLLHGVYSPTKEKLLWASLFLSVCISACVCICACICACVCALWLYEKYVVKCSTSCVFVLSLYLSLFFLVFSSHFKYHSAQKLHVKWHRTQCELRTRY